MSVSSWRNKFEAPAQTVGGDVSPFGPRRVVKQSAERLAVDQPTKSRVAVDKVLKVEAMLLYRRSTLFVQKKRVLDAVEEIQRSFRLYLRNLGDSADSRRVTRTLKRERKKAIEKHSASLILSARDVGSSIVAQEQSERTQLIDKFVPLMVFAVHQNEKALRLRVLCDESESFQSLINSSEVPSELLPGVIGDEWRSRAHIVSYFYFERQVLRQQLLARMFADCAQSSFLIRSLIIQQEQCDRVRLINRSREDLRRSHLFELANVESSHRALIEQQAGCSLSTLAQSHFSFLMCYLSEPERSMRTELERKESFFWWRIIDQFSAGKYERTFASVISREFSARCNGEGLETQEREARKKLIAWFFNTLVLRIQGGDLCDENTEASGRLTIEILEMSQRKTIMRLVEEDALQTFLPVLEQRSRKRILQEEDTARNLTVISSGSSLMRALWIEEPYQRRFIERASRRSMMSLVFHCAQLRLLSAERSRRKIFESAAVFFVERLSAFCLLSHLEVSQRRHLRKVERKLRNRTHLFHLGAEEVTRSELSPESIIDTDEAFHGFVVAVHHAGISRVSTNAWLPWK